MTILCWYFMQSMLIFDVHQHHSYIFVWNKWPNICIVCDIRQTIVMWPWWFYAIVCSFLLIFFFWLSFLSLVTCSLRCCRTQHNSFLFINIAFVAMIESWKRVNYATIRSLKRKWTETKPSIRIGYHHE